jgi:hypothetical protein
MSGPSPAGRPMSETPISTPSAVQCSGMLTADWPVRLYICVNGVNEP